MSGAPTHSLTTQVGQLAHRSVLRTLRQPAQIVPALIFPLFLLAVNSGGLKDATNLPGFPTDSYLTFALAVPFMQGALFSVMNSGTDLARDIETGFLNRLALTPLRGAALRTGTGEAVQSLFPVFFVFLFLSSMALPLDLLQTQWFHDVASANPVSYLLNAFRSLLIEGWELGPILLGFGIALAILVLGMYAAASALKTRLVRT